MDSFDLTNGIFELIGAVMLAFNVRKLYKDKMIRGVHWGPTGFFSAWGLWNIFYYPHLGQWFSFAGGVALVIFNIIWCGQMIYYSKYEGGRS
jgi:hypothetical protein